MRLLFLLCPVFIFAFDFIFEEDFVYKLNENEYNLDNEMIIIDAANIKHKIAQNIYKGLITQSKSVFDENLNYYYHSKKFQHYKEDLSELKKENESYKTKNKFKDLKNCFVIFKKTSHKNMQTKASAMLVDMDSLDSTQKDRIYFNCLKNQQYIF